MNRRILFIIIPAIIGSVMVGVLFSYFTSPQGRVIVPTTSKGGFTASAPPNAYGSTASFNVSRAIPTIANKNGAWATAGNLVNWLDPNTYAESSLTYAYNITGVRQGWYFWYGLNGSGTYHSINYDPTGHNFHLVLYNRSGQWEVGYNDTTQGRSEFFDIYGAPNESLYGKLISLFFVESAYTECTNWSSMNGTAAVTFSNFRYLDDHMRPISYSPIFGTLDHGPSCTTGQLKCLNQDKVTMKVSWKGCGN